MTVPAGVDWPCSSLLGDAGDIIEEEDEDTGLEEEAERMGGEMLPLRNEPEVGTAGDAVLLT